MHHYRWLLVLRPRPYFRASGQRTTYAPPSPSMIYCIAWTPVGVSKLPLDWIGASQSHVWCFARRGSREADHSGMLDMSAAFDCVDHINLVRRLNVSFGIDENALEWIVSYITGRRQYVRYNGRTSEISVVECGVPQDSVLGPLYFVLFTADVFGIADEHGFAIHGYADGMQIYDPCVVDDMHHLTSRPVDCIGSIEVWMTNNRLKLNASETEFIWFGSARRLARCTFESIVINDNGSSILPSKTVRNV